MTKEDKEETEETDVEGLRLNTTPSFMCNMVRACELDGLD